MINNQFPIADCDHVEWNVTNNFHESWDQKKRTIKTQNNIRQFQNNTISK